MALHGDHTSNGRAEAGQDLGIGLPVHFSCRCHDPIGHADHESRSIQEHGASDHVLDDFATDFIVGPHEDPQHIAAADYAHEPAVAVHDRQPLDGPVVHELRSLSHAIPWPNRYRRNARQLPGSCAASPLALLPPAVGLEHVLLSKVDPVFLENQVRFRDDTYDSPLAVNHRQGADRCCLMSSTICLKPAVSSTDTTSVVIRSATFVFTRRLLSLRSISFGAVARHDLILPALGRV